MDNFPNQSQILSEQIEQNVVLIWLICSNFAATRTTLPERAAVGSAASAAVENIGGDSPMPEANDAGPCNA